MQIRKIVESDNEKLAKIIRDSFEELALPKEGTVYDDPRTDDLYSNFQTLGAVYWVAEDEGKVLGGCGLYPTAGLPDGYAELAKFYLHPDARGKGLGKGLMAEVITSARELGYKTLYIESFPELIPAITMYEKIGFKHIDHCLGDSKHDACTVWMIMDL